MNLVDLPRGERHMLLGQVEDKRSGMPSHGSQMLKSGLNLGLKKKEATSGIGKHG
jgi:hypothetical protein